MLILGIKLDRSFFISTPDGDIEVKVLDIERDCVQIGVIAPKNMLILRDNLYEAAKVVGIAE